MNADNKVTLHDDALALVFLRNEFYKKKFHIILLFLVFSLFGVCTAVTMLVYLVKNPPHPLYFVADSVGKLVIDVPVSEPNMTIEEVTDWVIEAVQSATTFSYLNYRAELQSAQKYFTPFGWNSYMKALTDSNNILAVTTRKMIQFGTVVDRPQLIVSGHMGNAYAYQFSMPLLVTVWSPPYNDDVSSKSSNAETAIVTVARQDLQQSYKG